MKNHSFFSRNYSENDINNLIKEKRYNIDFLNRILDNDVHLNMISESNSPLKDKLKYITNECNINSKNHEENRKEILNTFNKNKKIKSYQNKDFAKHYFNYLRNNRNKYQMDNYHIKYFQNENNEKSDNSDNTIQIHDFSIKSENTKNNVINYDHNKNFRIRNYHSKNYEYDYYDINDNEIPIENNRYNYMGKDYNDYIDIFNSKLNNKTNIDYSLINSINVNKPFHREKRHYAVFNRGNFFKNMKPFLNENTHSLDLNNINYNNNYETINDNKTEKNRKYNFERINNNKSSNRRYILKRNDKNLIRRNIDSNIKKCSSMSTIPLNNSVVINRNNRKNEKPTILPYDIKYYNPRRNDYEGSRYGDSTYNYFLNGPMRGDISADWKFPPVYYYNSIKEKRLPKY